ncbi:T9SS type A sorting domain-containing protein [Runella zeae]|uniref:T9SS type A sorting domain-containing protein n=1 Tax=Runella zeae TaxID=94255 RepID=UPI00048B3A3A
MSSVFYVCFFRYSVKNQFQLGFKVPREGNVKIDIINLQGKIIRTLSNKKYSSGVYYLTHDCTAEPTGVYLCKMELDGAFVKTEKLIIEK